MGNDVAFEFELEDTVKLVLSNEVGEVIGRAEYVESRRQYLLRYLSADGRQLESWWSEDAIMRA